MKIIGGCPSIALTHSVCRILKTRPIEVLCRRFPDGEITIHITEALQTDSCLLIHSLSEPVNDNVMTLLLTIDELKRSGAGKITVCLPYLAYTRQKHTMSLVASLLHTAGAHQCITIDPHSHVENAAIPIEVLSTAQLFADHIKATHSLDDLVIVSPDQGGIESCKQIHHKLGLKSDLIHVNKVRIDGVCTVQAIHGDVRGKRCIIVDDIIDTGTTLCSAAEALIKQGAVEVSAYCTHGVLSGEALERVQKSSIKKLVITNTIAPKMDTLNASKIELLSIAALFASHVHHLQFHDA